MQVPVERIEAVTVRRYTSRAGDPHRHLHLQVNARVFAVGTWRGLHTVGFRDSIEALNGIGHAAVATDPEFRAALEAAGFTLDAESGEIRELARYAEPFSAGAAQTAAISTAARLNGEQPILARQWEETFSRDRADLGPTVAAQRAAEDVERYGPKQPQRPAYPGQRRIRRVPETTQTSCEVPDYMRPTAQGPGIGR